MVQEVPEETCTLEPQKECKQVTKLVPLLKPAQECVDIPKEVCVRQRTNPRRVSKPVIKKWCYTPKDPSRYKGRKNCFVGVALMCPFYEKKNWPKASPLKMTICYSFSCSVKAHKAWKKKKMRTLVVSHWGNNSLFIQKFPGIWCSKNVNFVWKRGS